MPLSQILIDGENWVAAGPDPVLVKPITAVVTRRGHAFALGSLGEELRGKGLSIQPIGIALWPDQGTLVVGDECSEHLWTFRIDKAGKLDAAEPYYSLQLARRGDKSGGVTALTVDRDGRLYACTPLGIQVFDPTGRLSGVLLKPGAGEVTIMGFGGKELNELTVVCGGRLFFRKLQAKGVEAAPSKKP
jgi:sugar lactone lactonase YvrE